MWESLAELYDLGDLTELLTEPVKGDRSDRLVSRRWPDWNCLLGFQSLWGFFYQKEIGCRGHKERRIRTASNSYLLHRFLCRNFLLILRTVLSLSIQELDPRSTPFDNSYPFFQHAGNHGQHMALSLFI